MAKQIGIILLKGTIDGINFYVTKDGYLARKASGMDAHVLATNPKYERTRKNCQEFGYSVKMSHLIQKSIRDLVIQAKDYRLNSRLTQIMIQLKNLDTTAEHGNRKVSIGLQKEEGKLILKGFNFNIDAPFESVFNGNYHLDSSTGTLTLKNFSPLKNITNTGGGTHVRLSVAMSRVDFETGVYQTTYSEKLILPLTDAVATQTLVPLSVPTGNGVQLFYFLLEFFQELNGTQYPLRNNAHNVLFLMEVL